MSKIVEQGVPENEAESKGERAERSSATGAGGMGE